MEIDKEEKISRRESSAHLKRRAPEGSDEWMFFNEAETNYELAECLKNRGPKAHRARQKAVRAFNKGWQLFLERTSVKE